ncbi:hypothetical protein [Yinghuangia aomiensis]|uniref:hypothetical protein n=1 Tax=Yinghuangia aomiensis TaxID=676205 RepID=UPI0031EDCB1D
MADVLWEFHVGPVLNVRVVIESDRCFRVEDDGPGLPIHPVGPRWDPAPWVVRMFRELVAGACPPRGVGLAVPTAACSQVAASVRRDGRHYQVDSGFGRETRLTDLGPAEGHGTSMRFVLDEEYLTSGAVLPQDPAAAIEAAIDTPLWSGKTKVRGRVDVRIEDLRTGSRVLRTVLPNGTGRCSACIFDCEDPLAGQA